MRRAEPREPRWQGAIAPAQVQDSVPEVPGPTLLSALLLCCSLPVSELKVQHDELGAVHRCLHQASRGRAPAYGWKCPIAGGTSSSTPGAGTSGPSKSRGDTARRVFWYQVECVFSRYSLSRRLGSMLCIFEAGFCHSFSFGARPAARLRGCTGARGFALPQRPHGLRARAPAHPGETAKPRSGAQRRKALRGPADPWSWDSCWPLVWTSCGSRPP